MVTIINWYRYSPLLSKENLVKVSKGLIVFECNVMVNRCHLFLWRVIQVLDDRLHCLPAGKEVSSQARVESPIQGWVSPVFGLGPFKGITGNFSSYLIKVIDNHTNAIVSQIPLLLKAKFHIQMINFLQIKC